MVDTKYNILYVDDEEINLRSFKNTFRAEFNIYTALSGKEGLKILDENNIDLIITDQRMPEMTGVEFLQKALIKNPEPNRILITGYSDIEALGKAVNEGKIYQYVQKPWKESVLKPIIEQALDVYQVKKQNKELTYELTRKNAVLANLNLQLNDELIFKSEAIKKITESEKQAKTNESKLLALLEAVPDSVLVVDSSHKITLTNKQSSKMFGYSQEQLIGMQIETLIPSKYRKSHEHHQATYIENPIAREMGKNVELFALKNDGSEFPVEISLGPLHVNEELIVLTIVRDITERKSKQDEINKLALVAENTSSAVIITNAAGRFDWVNKSFEELTEYTLNEVIGKKPGALLQGEKSSESTIIELRNAIKNRTPIKTEIVNYTKTGRKIWIELNIQPLYNEKGELIGFIAIVNDITARINAEKKLRESEEQFRNLFENSPIGIYQTTPDGKILQANRALIEMLEFSSLSELQNRDLEQDGYSKNSSINRQKFVEMIEQNGFVKGLEESWVTKSGKIVHIRENARNIRGKDNNTLYYEGTVEDISERKEAEKEILRLNQELENKVKERTKELENEKVLSETIINSLPGIFNLIDIETQKVIQWNSTTVTYSGLTNNELNSLNAFDLIAEEDREKAIKGMEQAIQTGSISFEANMKHNNGTKKPFYFTGVVVTINNKKFLVGIGTDISDLKNAQQKLKAINKELNDQKKELEIFNKSMIDREMRNIELKKEVNALALELKNEIPYPSALYDKET